jgi:hypothetical protein
VLPIRGAAIVGNIREEYRGGPATFLSAQALISCLLPHGGQNQKCLRIIHQMIFF